jgi:predicted RNA-binding Zn ribbon-like protein
VNTLDLEDGIDVLDRGWLVDNGLLGRDDELQTEALRELKDIREAIRALLLANNGVAVDLPRAAASLDHAAARVGLAVRFRPDGSATLEAKEPGTGMVGAVLAAVAGLAGTTAWHRLKACRANDCRWAFTDDSRNRSRAWCSMAVCGNRAKARAYRARH